MIATKEVAARHKSGSDDPTGLGRWTSILTGGREGYNVRYVCVYNPVAPSTASVNGSYRQQQRYYQRLNNFNDPFHLLQKDLCAALESWLGDGEHIFLMLDANQDIRSGPLAQAFKDLGLNEGILSRHSDLQPPVPTQQLGSKPIDGFFTTLDLTHCQSGYLAFGEGFGSDHRLAWMDIPFEVAFGHNPPNLYHLDPSRLSLQDPRVVAKYHSKVLEGYESKRVFDKLDDLSALVETHAPLSAIITLYDEIALSTRRIRKKVEEQLRKLHMGKHPWSPDIQLWMDTRKLWTNVIKLRLRMKISKKKIRRQMKRLDITDALEVTLREAQIRRDSAQKEWLTAIKNAPDLRKTWLESLSQARAEKNGTTAEAELKQLKHKEKQRDAARRRRAITGKGSDKAKTTKMFYSVLDPATGEVLSKVECNDQDTMGQAGVRENETRMTRALQSCFSQSPLLDDFGNLADTDAADAVLAGTYDPPPGINQFAKRLLDEMRIPAAAVPISPEDLDWSPEDVARAWRSQRLNTSAEPTGLSFAHLIVGSTDPSIAAVDAVLHNLPFKLGFSPKSWQIITDVAILKSKGVYDVEKMRTIMLLDTYYNMNNKRLGRLIMEQSEKHGQIPGEQYGSRNLHCAPDLGLNKTLIFDISRMKRWAIALLPFDASQCYDRMHHVPTSLAIRSTGVPAEPVHSTFATLQEATHHVATAYGVSTQSYGGSQRRAQGLQPPQGTGQGSGKAPAAHNIAAAKPVQILRKMGLALQFLAAFTLTAVVLACLQYVDDTDQGVSGPNELTVGEDIPDRAQQAADVWEGCLNATGGAINLAKSCWYLIDYKWSGTAWSYRKIADVKGEVKVRDIDGQTKTLPRKEPSESVKSLGMFPAPDGNTAAQVAHLRTKGKAFASRIRGKGKKLRNDVWITTQTTIMKTFEYPMRAICLTKKDWAKVMPTVLQAAKQKSGYSKHFPNAVLYGPKEFLGLGMKDPWVTQELKHLEALWEKATCMDISGQLIQQEFEALRMELGTPDPITDHHFALFGGCTTQCWMKTLWQSCEDFNVKFDDPFFKPKLQRHGDQFLMHAFATEFPPKELAILNQCRMFLRVLTLADISSADGQALHAYSYDGIQRAPHLHRYGWPRQPPKLPPTHWNLWRHALDTCFRKTYASAGDISLENPLGPWLVDPLRIWPWLLNKDTNRLYHREGLMFQEYAPADHAVNLRNIPYIKVERIDRHSPDPNLRPVYKLPPGTYLVVDAFRHRLPDRKWIGFPYDATGPPPDPQDARPTTLAGALDLLPASDRWAVQHLYSADEGRSIAKEIIKGTAIAVSDGSYKDNFGTSAFIFHAPTTGARLTGRNCIPGAPEDQSAHRSEVGGIVGMAVALHLLCNIYDITDGKIILGLDGKSALNSASSKWDPKCQKTDFDILWEARKQLAALPITVEFKWVEGHQDDKPLMNLPADLHTGSRQHHGCLDNWAKLNIEADLKARDFWDRHHQRPVPNCKFTHERMAVTLNGQKLAQFRLNHLYQAVKEPEIKRHWHRREAHLRNEPITDTEWDDMWQMTSWKPHGKAFRTLPMGKQRWITKHATGFCGVGRVLLRNQWQDHSECPRCGQDNEDTIHVLRCPQARANTQWNTCMETFSAWMDSNHTNLELSRWIKLRLGQWRRGATLTPVLSNPHVRRAIRDQDRLGWWQFLLGRIPKSMVDAQAHHLQRSRPVRRIEPWSKGLILQVWEISFAMWSHRNVELHGETLTPQQASQLDSLRQSIRDEFTKGPDTLLPRDRWFLLEEQKDWALKQTLPQSRRWLETVQLSRHAHAGRQAQPDSDLARQQSALRSWLGTAAPPRA